MRTKLTPEDMEGIFILGSLCIAILMMCTLMVYMSHTHSPPNVELQIESQASIDNASCQSRIINMCRHDIAPDYTCDHRSMSEWHTLEVKK